MGHYNDKFYASLSRIQQGDCESARLTSECIGELRQLKSRSSIDQLAGMELNMKFNDYVSTGACPEATYIKMSMPRTL